MTKYNPYQKTAVTTASKEQILLMLYEAAIKHLNKAAECTKAGDVAGKGVAVGKAHDIVNELSNSLDMKVGGEVAANLERLYSFVVDQIIQGNLNNEYQKFEQARKILETLYEGWKGAVAQVQAQKAQGKI